MRLTKRGKHVVAFAAVWGAMLLVGALIFAFPKVIAGLILGGCVVMLMLLTWQIAGSYINE